MVKAFICQFPFFLELVCCSWNVTAAVVSNWTTFQRNTNNDWKRRNWAKPNRTPHQVTSVGSTLWSLVSYGLSMSSQQHRVTWADQDTNQKPGTRSLRSAASTLWNRLEQSADTLHKDTLPRLCTKQNALHLSGGGWNDICFEFLGHLPPPPPPPAPRFPQSPFSIIFTKHKGTWLCTWSYATGHGHRHGHWRHSQQPTSRRRMDKVLRVCGWGHYRMSSSRSRWTNKKQGLSLMKILTR